MVVEPTSTAIAERGVGEAGEDAPSTVADAVLGPAQRDRRGPGVTRERGVQLGEHVRIDRRDRQPVLLAQCARRARSSTLVPSGAGGGSST